MGVHEQKNFFTTDEEMFLRSWWLAENVLAEVWKAYSPSAVSAYIADEHFREQDQIILSETIGYTMSFVLNRMKDEIDLNHGFTKKTDRLHKDYILTLGIAFDQAIGYGATSERIFGKIIEDYYSPDYDDGYDHYWMISIFGPEDTEVRFGEIYKNYYNPERLYVYRLHIKFGDVSHYKLLHDLRILYRDIGLSFYDQAFFRLDRQQIEEQLKQVVNLQL